MKLIGKNELIYILFCTKFANLVFISYLQHSSVQTLM